MLVVIHLEKIKHRYTRIVDIPHINDVHNVGTPHLLRFVAFYKDMYSMYSFMMASNSNCDL